MVHIPFPFPHDMSSARIRIARKAGWIEVITLFPKHFDINISPFPVVRDTDAERTVVWSLPRLLINSLPTIILANSNPLGWIHSNLKSSFAADEIVSFKNHLSEHMAQMIYEKYSIYSILCSTCDFEGTDLRVKERISDVIMLQQNDSLQRIRAFIFIDGIKLDSSNHTVIADTYMWPVTTEIAERHKHDIESLARNALLIKCEPKVLL